MALRTGKVSGAFEKRAPDWNARVISQNPKTKELSGRTAGL